MCVCGGCVVVGVWWWVCAGGCVLVCGGVWWVCGGGVRCGGAWWCVLVVLSAAKCC